MRVVAAFLILTWGVVSACAPTHNVFPSRAMEGIDHNFDFAKWHVRADGSESKKVQLGGAILQSTASGGTVTIVVAQLPIVERPAYGPKENGKNNGQFAITFQGQVESAMLQTGNRVMVVGMTHPREVVTVNDLSRSFPIVEAHCLHFWNTQGRSIADFPFYEAGYVPLIQETVCANAPAR